MSEIRVDNIRSQSGASSPSFPHGANVTGVVTATTFSGDLPAAELTGTIADARLGTVSSSKLSGALPALDAANLIGVKAEPTIDIVASGSIGAGKAVVVTSDGKAGIVTGTNIGFGDKNVFSTASSTWGYVAYDTTNNRVVVAWRDQGVGKGYARVGTVTGTSISWGTAVEFQNSNPYYTNAIFNANTGKVIIVNSDAGNSQHGTCIIGTVSGTSISFGSIVEFSSTNTFGQFALFNVGTTNKFVIGYKSDGNSYAIAATISGTTPTFGTGVELYGNNWSYADGEWHTASETGVVVFYDAAGSIQVKCISVTGTTIDKDGDTVQLTSGNTAQAYPAIEYDPVNEKMMIAWMSVQESTSPERGSMIATGVPYSPGSGTKRSWRTQSVRAIEDVYGDYLSSTFDTVNNEMYIIYRGDSYQASRLIRARIISGDIDDPTGALGVGNTFGGYERVAVTTPVGFAGSYPMRYFSSMAFDPTGKKVFAMFPYYYDPASDNWSVWASSIQDSNLTSENFLGFSKDSYTNGQTATIKIAGAIDTSQVGLSTGKKYYMLPDASLTNTPSISGQFFNDPEGKYGYISAGIALSTTNLIIKT